jgi:hypothetical protein
MFGGKIFGTWGGCGVVETDRGIYVCIAYMHTYKYMHTYILTLKSLARGGAADRLSYLCMNVYMYVCMYVVFEKDTGTICI